MSRRLTICEVHRKLHRSLKKEGLADSKTSKLLTLAYLSGKAMSKTLKSFKSGWDKGWWKEIKDD